MSTPNMTDCLMFSASSFLCTVAGHKFVSNMAAVQKMYTGSQQQQNTKVSQGELHNAAINFDSTR